MDKDNKKKKYICKKEAKEAKVKPKKSSSREKLVEDNIVRKISNFIRKRPILNQILGYYYVILHGIIATLGILVLLFSNNIIHLACLLIVIILDSMCIVFLHDCPLTMLEKKYLKISAVSTRFEALHKSNIVFECNHEYESQLELLINVWSFCAIKMFAIILLRTNVAPILNANLELSNIPKLYLV
jgi:hypothetical protein